MKSYELIRSYLQDRTVGWIQSAGDGEFIAATLEPPWLDNAVNKSCIPEGVYTVRRDEAGRFQWYRVENVPGRTAIELHEGIVPGHSNGCILIGSGFDNLFNLTDTGHGATLRKMTETMPDEFSLRVTYFDPTRDKWPEELQ